VDVDGSESPDNAMHPPWSLLRCLAKAVLIGILPVAGFAQLLPRDAMATIVRPDCPRGNHPTGG